MGPPGVGVGTCMRIVAPVLLVWIGCGRYRIDSFVSLEVRHSKGNAARNWFWFDCGSGSARLSWLLEVCSARGVNSGWRDDPKNPRGAQAAKVSLGFDHGRVSTHHQAGGSPRSCNRSAGLLSSFLPSISRWFLLCRSIWLSKSSWTAGGSWFLVLIGSVCPKCNRSYILSEISEGQVHLPAILPQNENLCDDCNVPLVVRSDDNPKIIEARYDIFEERTKPVLEFYRQKKILCEFGIKQGVQDLPAILRNILIHFLSKYNL